MRPLTVTDNRVRPHEIAEAAMECLHNSPYRALRTVSCECKHGVLFLRACFGNDSTHHSQEAC